jgi:hypothetical protein
MPAAITVRAVRVVFFIDIVLLKRVWYRRTYCYNNYAIPFCSRGTLAPVGWLPLKVAVALLKVHW